MKTYPIFRLALFLAAGIFFAEAFQLETGLYGIAALLVLLLILGVCLRYSPYQKRWLFGAGVSCVMLLVGMLQTEYAWRNVRVDWATEKQVYRGAVQETLVGKKRTFQCKVEVDGKEVLLYLPKDSSAGTLKIGDGLLFYARIDSPRNGEVPHSFDYARYLYHKGVSGTAYVPTGYWVKMEAENVKTWKQEALLLRERILAQYQRWGIGEKELPVLAALTLGYKHELDEELKTSYSVAGISHVLALSGMHVGIVWLLLDGMLGWVFRRRFLIVKWLLGTAFLWGFAFVVGLEASVVRAVVMCMLMGLGKLFGARVFSLNTLSIAAFFMLLYNPFYLFDVGFQLSFVAVASILIFSPFMWNWLPKKNGLVRWGGGMMAVSIAAQLGTAPLLMYYFSNFSVYFLLANSVAAMLVPLIIYGACLLFMTSFVPAIQEPVVESLNLCISWLNGMATWTSGLPGATFSLSVWHPVEMLVFYVSLFLLWEYWKKRKRIWLIRLLVAVACLLSLHLWLIFWDRF